MKRKIESRLTFASRVVGADAEWGRLIYWNCKFMKTLSTMFVTTTDVITGKEITETLGMVMGNTIRARHIGSDIGAGLKSLVGGEIKGYVKAMTDAREEALQRMQQQAKDMGADAVVSVRFTTSQIMTGAAEILAYGTAVKLR